MSLKSRIEDLAQALQDLAPKGMPQVIVVIEFVSPDPAVPRKLMRFDAGGLRPCDVDGNFTDEAPTVLAEQPPTGPPPTRKTQPRRTRRGRGSPRKHR